MHRDYAGGRLTPSPLSQRANPPGVTRIPANRAPGPQPSASDRRACTSPVPSRCSRPPAGSAHRRQRAAHRPHTDPGRIRPRVGKPPGAAGTRTPLRRWPARTGAPADVPAWLTRAPATCPAHRSRRGAARTGPPPAGRQPHRRSIPGPPLGPPDRRRHGRRTGPASPRSRHRRPQPLPRHPQAGPCRAVLAAADPGPARRDGCLVRVGRHRRPDRVRADPPRYRAFMHSWACLSASLRWACALRRR